MLTVFCIGLYFIVGFICYFITNIKIKIDERDGNHWLDHDRIPLLVTSFIFWPALIVGIGIYKVFSILDGLCNNVVEFLNKISNGNK